MKLGRDPAVDNKPALWWDYKGGWWTLTPDLSFPDSKPDPEPQKSVPVMMKIPCMEEGGSVFRLEKVIARVDDLEREKNAEILALNTKIAELEERIARMDVTMQTRWTATSSFTTQMLANLVDVKEKVQVTANGLLGLCDSYKLLYGDNEGLNTKYQDLNKKYQDLTTILGEKELSHLSSREKESVSFKKN